MLTVIVDLIQSIFGAFASGKTVAEFEKDEPQDKIKK
ncbi:hypothetical protein AMBR_MGDJBKAP_01774 [Leuconostoc pseudomesenteroides]|jgi:hypothetical protein|nr:hypothetical protein AMBR_MGDJBKAP_01774 [Leuconostoc pseudomesenteroides]